MVPTCAISSLVETFLARACRSLTTSATARSTPRLRSIGFMPAATDLAPSFTMAWASTVAVVVPSPATVLVLDATSRTICAPMFSNLSASSISFATVTPSLVTRGAPKLFSSTTLRPFGPSVTLTASARISTPRSILLRASTENLTSLAAMSGLLHPLSSLVPSAYPGWGRRRDVPDLRRADLRFNSPEGECRDASAVETRRGYDYLTVGTPDTAVGCLRAAVAAEPSEGMETQDNIVDNTGPLRWKP